MTKAIWTETGPIMAMSGATLFVSVRGKPSCEERSNIKLFHSFTMVSVTLMPFVRARAWDG